MRVCVTGISGSLGRAILSRLARDGADRIVGITRQEHVRYALEQQYAWHPGIKIHPGDVRQPDRRLADHVSGCDVLIHAAARKVVSGHNDEPAEMLDTNILGTRNMLEVARDAGVRQFLFISSDKACAPINCYGVSKAMAEALVISSNAHTFNRNLRASVLRYGNVLASNGSVVRVWRELRAQGKPLPFSDTRMTRFWLTLSDAVEHILRALSDLRGGEVFVPELKAAPLVRLCEAVAPSASIVPLGVRPGGEKLHEELLTADEARRVVRRNGFYVVPPPRTLQAWDVSPWLGEPVEEGFTYRSDTWPHTWSVEELRGLLEPVGDPRVEVRA